MKKFIIVLFLPILITIVSCKGDKNKEKEETTTKEEKTDNTNTENTTNNNQPDANKNSRYEQRKAKGDTLAMAYKSLQVYLPDVNGYTKNGGPKGSQFNAPGMGSWSEASQEYSNGDKSLSIKIIDYNSAFQALQSVTMVYGMGWSAEDDTKKQGPADLGVKDVAGYETVYKTEKRQELTVVIADRFFITLEGHGEDDAAFLHNVARMMKLGEMAAL